MCLGRCNSDSRYKDAPHMKDVTFISFPKPETSLMYAVGETMWTAIRAAECINYLAPYTLRLFKVI